VEHRVLLESFRRARKRILKGHKEPIDTAIIKLSFMSTILEEHGRQFMAAEWYKMKKIGDCIQGGG
jgi:hypothetical protein